MGLNIDPNNRDPGYLGQQSLQASGSWMGPAGSIATNISNTLAGAYQSRVAYNNAALAQQQGQAELQAGEYGAEIKKLQTGQLIGEQKAGQAAHNIDVGGGSAAAVRGATQEIGNIDAAMIMYNAKRAAWASGVEAQSLRAQGALGMARTITGAIGGGADTYASFLARSRALTGAALGFGQVGVTT